MTNKERKAYIFGAGITGLAAGKNLSDKGFKVIVFEKNDFIGGLSATFRKDGYRLDLGPHKIFSVMDNILDEAKSLLGDELLTVKKSSKIRLLGKYLDYPVSIKDLLFGLKPLIIVKFVLDYFAVTVKKIFIKPPERSYKDWIVSRFGNTIYNIIFGPYANKIWTDPATLDKELAETRIAVPNLFKILTGMVLGIKDKNTTLHASIFYYAKYGSSALAEKLSWHIIKNGGEIRLSDEIAEITVVDNSLVSFATKKSVEFNIEKDDVVISTMPLNELKHRIRDIPFATVRAMDLLKTKNLILQYVIVNKPKITDDNWIFFPESKYIFNRVFEQKNFSRFMLPDNNTTVLCAEVTCDSNDKLSSTDENTIFELVAEQLEECKLVRKIDIIAHFDKRLRDVYPIYDLEYKKNKRLAFDYLDSINNFFSIGRSGGFDYTGMLDCLDIGIKTADFISQNREDRLVLRNYFKDYIVVD